MDVIVLQHSGALYPETIHNYTISLTTACN